SPDLTVPPGSYLHAWGEQTQLLVQTRQGQVFRGKQVPISGDVLVNVSHGVGLVSVWINHNADFTDTISGNNQPLPAQIKLTGRQQTIVFERDKAGFISLQAATPVIARIRRNGLQDQVSVFDSGLKTTLFLPKGKSQLQLESTTEQALASLLNLTEIAQAELNEGLGNPVSLLPGDTRVYRLNISKPQDIGIGVHAAVDVAQLYLFDQHGALLGEGVSQKHKLTRGHYYLMIELPPQAGSSVDIRPAIVGLESRDTGPSKEIMLDYQQYSSPEIL
ncbi:MAG: hypothetical protein GY784_07395, partial [Gammaproteobacteria bacterium]|nr:hypothetical protein [Gammaproteobacteria bacterium]